MATVTEIITGAIVETGVRGIRVTPSADELARGLVLLQAAFLEAVEAGAFGKLNDYKATAAYTAKEQDRVYSAGFTITLPTTITDAFTGDARRPKDLALIVVVNASTAPQVSVYDAHTAAWTRLDNLTATTDPCPFSGRNRHGLECILARTMASSLKVAIPASTAAYAGGLVSIFSQRPLAARQPTQAEFY